MSDYQQVFQFLEVPLLAMETAAGRVSLPLDLAVPFRRYGFPPALLPLWSTGAIYHGYWKHWFSPRSLALVEMDVAQKRQTHEVARNFPQLIREMTLFDVSWNEEIRPAVRDSARQTGISDQELVQMEEVVAASGDHPSGWLLLPGFAENPPRPCVSEGTEYYGDFPFHGMALTEQNVRLLCTFEVDEPLSREITGLSFAPPWFLTDKQPPVFERLLQAGDYSGAWMSLNSTGWRFAEAAEALQRLASAVAVPGFDLLVNAWIDNGQGKVPVTADVAGY